MNLGTGRNVCTSIMKTISDFLTSCMYALGGALPMFMGRQTYSQR